MKQKLKNYLTFGTFLFGILFVIIACQEETIGISAETSQEKRLKRISLKELNSKIANNKDYNRLSLLFDIN